jgi:hypothetical protein
MQCLTHESALVRSREKYPNSFFDKALEPLHPNMKWKFIFQFMTYGMNGKCLGDSFRYKERNCDIKGYSLNISPIQFAIMAYISCDVFKMAYGRDNGSAFLSFSKYEDIPGDYDFNNCCLIPQSINTSYKRARESLFNRDELCLVLQTYLCDIDKLHKLLMHSQVYLLRHHKEKDFLDMQDFIEITKVSQSIKQQEPTAFD